jgi:hypothetical protein
MRNANIPAEKGGASIQVKISAYNIYLSRQGFVQNGFSRESNGLITLSFSEVSILNNKVSKIVLYFIAEGGVNQKFTYNGTEKSLIFEYPGADLSAWTSALIHPNEKKLDIESFSAEDIVKVYLSLSGK